MRELQLQFKTTRRTERRTSPGKVNNVWKYSYLIVNRRLNSRWPHWLLLHQQYLIQRLLDQVREPDMIPMRWWRPFLVQIQKEIMRFILFPWFINSEEENVIVVIWGDQEEVSCWRSHCRCISVQIHVRLVTTTFHEDFSLMKVSYLQKTMRHSRKLLHWQRRNTERRFSGCMMLLINITRRR